jgi:predicted esterase
MTTDPHANQPVLRHGPAPADARLSAILVHGRGASAEDILSLAEELKLPDVAWWAPQAAGSTWYPFSFLAPIPQNEPGLTSGLNKIGSIIETLEREGVAGRRIALLGFSQGACLSLEFAARHAQRFAAVIGLSGGLVGPPGTPRAYGGSLDGTPVFLGCSDIDPHIPLARVHESAEIFRRLGAAVDERIYPGMGHLVNRDELDAISALLRGGVTRPPR